MMDAHQIDTMEGEDLAVTDGDDAVTVHWNARPRSRLRRLGLAGSVTGSVDVVVVDRRDGQTTPVEPRELTVDGQRVVVVPDRTAGAPPVEVWAAGHRARHSRVVRVLRRTVRLDARIDAAFQSARRRHRLDPGRSVVRADGGLSPPRTDPATPRVDAVESLAIGLDAADTSLAIGGFAATVDRLR